MPQDDWVERWAEVARRADQMDRRAATCPDDSSGQGISAREWEADEYRFKGPLATSLPLHVKRPADLLRFGLLP